MSVVGRPAHDARPTARRAASATRMRRLTAALALLAACASPGIPPGGPEDKLPPKLLQVVPDSGAVGTLPRAVVFRFDEVVNERPAAAPRLEDMFLVSPRGRGLDVEWNREEVWLRPLGGWRKDLIYTVTMLPGMADLRGNILKSGRTVVFATGNAIPDTRLTGALFDWVRGTPAPQTIVEAVDRRDTTIQYIALTDSSGRFSFRHLPAGAYLARASVAATSSIGGGGGASLRGFDRRRAWDSVAVTLSDSAQVELLAFAHDTLGPRIAALTVRDSVTLKLTLDQPIPASQPLSRDQFALLTKDSTPVFIDSIFTALAFAEWEKKAADSLAAARARRDSTARLDSQPRRDTARAATPPTSEAPRGVRQPAPGVTAPRLPGAPRPAPVVAVPPARPDSSTDSRTDSLRRVPSKPSKPSPITEFVLRLGSPLAPQSQFRLRVTDVKGLLGASRPSDRAFSTPKVVIADSSASKTPGAAPGGSGGARTPGFTPTPPRDSTVPPRKPPAAGESS